MKESKKTLDNHYETGQDEKFTVIGRELMFSLKLEEKESVWGTECTHTDPHSSAWQISQQLLPTIIKIVISILLLGQMSVATVRIKLLSNGA